MKNIYSVALALALGSGAAATAQPYEAVLSRVYDVPKTASASNSLLGEKGTLDTLTQYFERRSNLAIYQYAPNPQAPNQQLPITGTNIAYYFLGTKYSFSGSAKLNGLLVMYGAKFKFGQADSMAALAFNIGGQNNLPTGQNIASGLFTTDIIDTNHSTGLKLTSIPFAVPATVTSDFAVFVQTRTTGTDTADFHYIFSNENGNGRGENRAAFLNFENNQLVAGNLSNVFNTGGVGIDVDPMIFPVLDIESINGVEDYMTLDGLTVKGLSPNPAVNSTSIALSMTSPSDVEVNIMNAEGRVLRTQNFRDLQAGDQSLALDLSGLPSGNYFYSVSTAKARFAGKISLVR